MGIAGGRLTSTRPAQAPDESTTHTSFPGGGKIMGFLIILLLILVVYVGISYNKLQGLAQSVRMEHSNIQASMKKRVDLANNDEKADQPDQRTRDIRIIHQDRHRFGRYVGRLLVLL
jgi:hypothetical protein